MKTLMLNMTLVRPILILFLVWCLVNGIQAQTGQDTIRTGDSPQREKKGSIFKGRPGKSMLMSLVLPGTGQIYNKSYLRVPFVYAAVGGMGYVLHHNTVYYTVYRDAYRASIDGTIYDPPLSFPDRDNLLRITNPSQLRVLRDNANANRQTSIILFSLVWLANGIDAFVDAHLKDFDMDEDLSIQFRPAFDNDAFAPARVGFFVTVK